MPYAIKDIKEGREKRAELAKQANDILTAAATEGRDLTDEERTQFDTIHADIDQIGQDVQRMEKQNELDESLKTPEGRQASLESQSGEPPASDDEKRKQFDQQFRSWLMGQGGKEFSLRGGMLPEHELNKRLQLYREARNTREAQKLWEERAQSTTNSEGGHTIPEDFHNVLETAMLFFGGMRQIRTTILRTDNGADLPMPTADDTSNKGAILAENTQVSEQDVTFGSTTLGAFKYTSKAIRVSFELLQDSAFDMPNWLGNRLGERIGRITNEHFTTGDGSSKPNGVIPQATVGKTAASTTAVTYTEIVDLEHAVDRDYRQNAEFMFHDNVLRDLKQLTDDQSRPLWLPGLAVREPDTFLGYRYVVNNDMATPAADAKTIAFGDMSKYHIRDVMDIRLIRLDEVYAEWGQVAFLAFSRHDGNLLDAGTNPVQVLQQAAS